MFFFIFLLCTWASAALFSPDNKTFHSLINDTEYVWFELPHGLLRISYKSYKLVWTPGPIFHLKSFLHHNKLFHRSSYTLPGLVVQQCVLFPFDRWPRIRISPAQAHYSSEAAPAATGSGLLPQLVAEMNVARWESHPLGYLGPTLVDLAGTTGPESWCRHWWLFTGPGSPWELGGDGFWWGWWSLFQWD